MSKKIFILQVEFKNIIFLSLQNHWNHKEDIALSFQQGEEKGFTWFFKNFYPALTLYCFKITANKEAAEEIASHSFIKIWEKHERFSDEGSIKAYLYRIVHNDALKWLGKQKQEQTVSKEVIHLYGGEQEKDHFAQMVKAETLRELSNGIATLPGECRKVFHLLYVEGKSIKETAEALQLSVSTVKTQKARGIAALRKGLRLGMMVVVICLLGL